MQHTEKSPENIGHHHLLLILNYNMTKISKIIRLLMLQKDKELKIISLLIHRRANSLKSPIKYEKCRYIVEIRVHTSS